MQRLVRLRIPVRGPRMTVSHSLCTPQQLSFHRDIDPQLACLVESPANSSDARLLSYGTRTNSMI